MRPLIWIQSSNFEGVHQSAYVLVVHIDPSFLHRHQSLLCSHHFWMYLSTWDYVVTSFLVTLYKILVKLYTTVWFSIVGPIFLWYSPHRLQHHHCNVFIVLVLSIHLLNTALWTWLRLCRHHHCTAYWHVARHGVTRYIIQAWLNKWSCHEKCITKESSYTTTN